MVDGMWFTAQDGMDDEHGLYCCHHERCLRWMSKKSEIALSNWYRVMDYVKLGNWGPSHVRSVRFVKIFASAAEAEDSKSGDKDRNSGGKEVEGSVRRKRPREGVRSKRKLEGVRSKRKRVRRQQEKHQEKQQEKQQEKHLPQTTDVRVAQLIGGVARLTQAVEDLTTQSRANTGGITLLTQAVENLTKLLNDAHTNN